MFIIHFPPLTFYSHPQLFCIFFHSPFFRRRLHGWLIFNFIVFRSDWLVTAFRNSYFAIRLILCFDSLSSGLTAVCVGWSVCLFQQKPRLPTALGFYQEKPKNICLAVTFFLLLLTTLLPFYRKLLLTDQLQVLLPLSLSLLGQLNIQFSLCKGLKISNVCASLILSHNAAPLYILKVLIINFVACELVNTFHLIYDRIGETLGCSPACVCVTSTNCQTSFVQTSPCMQICLDYFLPSTANWFFISTLTLVSFWYIRCFAYWLGLFFFCFLYLCWERKREKMTNSDANWWQVGLWRKRRGCKSTQVTGGAFFGRAFCCAITFCFCFDFHLILFWFSCLNRFGDKKTGVLCINFSSSTYLLPVSLPLSVCSTFEKPIQNLNDKTHDDKRTNDLKDLYRLVPTCIRWISFQNHRNFAK